MEEVLRLLTACGVSPNVCGLRHKAALHLAAAQGHTAVVEVLLANGVSGNRALDRWREGGREGGRREKS